MAGRLPYFGRSYAVDDARELVKEQMRRNTQREIGTQRMATQLAISETEAVRAGAKEAATGAAKVETVRRYREAGIEPPASLVGKPGGGRALTSSKAAAEFRRGLTDGGLTNPYGLAAVTGHAQIESAGFQPTIRGDKNLGPGREAFGMLQWREGRQQGLRNFAKQQGGSPDDPYIQGLYAAEEMKTTERGPGAKIFNARNLEEAHQGMIAYERPGRDKAGRPLHDAERRAASAAWFKKGTSLKADEEFAEGAGNDGLTTINVNGREVRGLYANNADLRTIIENNRKLARRLRPVLEAGTKKGRFFYEVLPEGQVNVAATPPTVSAPAAPATQPKPTNAEPAVVPVSPAPVAIEDDDEVDPYTGE